MCDVEELNLETAELKFVLRFDDVELRFFEKAVVLKFVLHQPHRECAAVKRNVQIGQDKRKRPDMVFVAVRENDGFDFAAVFEKVSDVGDDDVDAEQFFIGEHDAGID